MSDSEALQHHTSIESYGGELQTQLEKWQQLSLQHHNVNAEFQAKLQSALTLLKMHTQCYQRIIITRRRRAQQRRKRRQMELRNFFARMMEDIQIQLVEMLPLCIEPSVLMKIAQEKSDEMFREWEASDSQKDTTKEDEPFEFFKNVACRFNEEQWVDTFHISKAAFNLLCPVLKEVLITEDDISKEAAIALCIYTLAKGRSFRSVGMLFNKPQTYVRSILYKFVQVLNQSFEAQFMNVPQTKEEVKKVCKGFSRASHMPPCCLGVLCVFELPTFVYTQPGCKSYGMDRVIVQTLIDDRLQFRKVEVEHQQPSMFLTKPNEIQNISEEHFAGSSLTCFVTAPPHYPLRSWLMQKYDKAHKQCELDFNEALNHLNIFRELALQRLFGRWQILSSSEFIEPQSKGLIAKACCILHNILEDCGEVYSEDWSENMDLSKYVYKYEETKNADENELEEAKEKRNHIARLIRREVNVNVN